MATSFVRSNENQHKTNTSLHDHLSEDCNNGPIRRSSTGRKKAKGGGGEQKIRRRGMGVEKLERLRIQEKLKHQMSTHQINNNNPFAAPSFQFPNPGQTHFGQMGQGHFHGFDQFHTTYNDQLMISSTPNGALNSQNRNTCHKKKKRVVGEYPGCGKVKKDVYNNMQIMSPPFGTNIGENHFLTTKLPTLVPHQVMEYEFFPDGRSKKTEESHDHLVPTSPQNSVTTGFDASTCIDLSLKLSY